MKEFDRLGTRSGFNRAVRHLQSTIHIDGMLASNQNIADVVQEEINDESIKPQQALPIANALLVTKHGYQYKSLNMESNITDFSGFAEEVAQWNTLDIVISYNHPNLGYVLINPKKMAYWEKIQDIMRDELVVVYAKYIGKEKDEKKISATIEKAIKSIVALLQGQKVSTDKDFVDPSLQAREKVQPQAPVQAAASSKKMSITPKYSVQVSNELFHNGNVEAWKNIIESFEASHPDLTVTVFHDGELIQDLNTLFKWGKVKHGGLIFFQVAGENIRNVSKLKRYLYEGASKRYESFMKKDMSRPLKLF